MAYTQANMINMNGSEANQCNSLKLLQRTKGFYSFSHMKLMPKVNTKFGL